MLPLELFASGHKLQLDGPLDAGWLLFVVEMRSIDLVLCKKWRRAGVEIYATLAPHELFEYFHFLLSLLVGGLDAKLH